ncbi:MAG: hypothetical protein CMM99_01635 [Rickettsiales bacterium]|nr:hypothetical protein [Rickettsiales bacterium]|tara:strand:- start:519 stop:1790 length:1272 start_codon:yes stop_codon:yes gene_type:complete
MTDQKIIFLSFNELNFDYLKRYIEIDKLKNFKKIINELKITTSEQEYQNLEPWIQWPTIYTGKKAEEHNIFRLGDVINSDHKTIFNDIEDLGFDVGVVSSMNLKNNLSHPLYFIPDPWTQTKPDNNFWSKLIHSTISKFVKKNSSLKINFLDLLSLSLIILKFAKIKNYFFYLNFIFTGFKYKWRQALFLDLLLNDIHLQYFKNKKPNFSNVFFNGIAHIQHHFFFNSKVIENNELKNPEWYVEKNKDPFGEALKIYDKILGDYLSRNDIKLILATGLTQTPYDTVKFYYKIEKHEEFFSRLKIDYVNIQELMSRDFIIYFYSEKHAKNAETILRNLKLNSKKIFKIDNRGLNLFITLVYPEEIKKNELLESSNIELYKYVSFVAVKNGMHNEKGFYYDNFSKNIKSTIKISEIKNIILKIFN